MEHGIATPTVNQKTRPKSKSLPIGQRPLMAARRMKARLIGLLLAALLPVACSVTPKETPEQAAYRATIKEAEALYKEKCKTVAGIKIHKTVPEVDGVLLLKIRPERTDRELSDPMWPGAAFGGESRGDGYIASFLGNESPTQGPIDAQHRGEITNNFPAAPNSLPGYRWVEVPDPKDGQRYRYTGSEKVVGRKDPTAYNVQVELKRNPDYDMNVYRWSLDKTPSPSKIPPRYAVTFEDHVIPEERARWVASSTIKVLDLQTNEVLGEMTRYAIAYARGSGYALPWVTHSVCPRFGTTSYLYDSRQFVDQILIPKREK